MTALTSIRVLHVTPTGEIGGRERQLFELSKALARRSIITSEVLFVRNEGPFYRAMCELPVKTHVAGSTTWRWRYWARHLNLFQQFDMVIFWGVTPALFIISLLAGNVRIYAMTGTRFLRHPGVNGRPRWAPNHVSSAMLKSRQFAGRIVSAVKRNAFAWFVRGCSKVLTPSSFMAETARSAYGVLPSALSIVPNFLDYDAIRTTRSRSVMRERLQIDPTDFVIGVVARYDFRKRIDRFIHAMVLAGGHESIKGVLIGGGSEAFEQLIRKWISDAHMENRIRVTGFVEDVYDYINCLDALVLPSDNEAFGLVLLEALFLRIPTIVFKDGGGVMDVIQHARTGYVVDSTVDLADLMSMAVSTDGMPRLTCDTRKYVLEQFSVGHTKAYENIFSRIARDSSL